MGLFKSSSERTLDRILARAIALKGRDPLSIGCDEVKEIGMQFERDLSRWFTDVMPEAMAREVAGQMPPGGDGVSKLERTRQVLRELFKETHSIEFGRKFLTSETTQDYKKEEEEASVKKIRQLLNLL